MAPLSAALAALLVTSAAAAANPGVGGDVKVAPVAASPGDDASTPFTTVELGSTGIEAPSLASFEMFTNLRCNGHYQGARARTGGGERWARGERWSRCRAWTPPRRSRALRPPFPLPAPRGVR
jgi:hypothetical protein